MVISCKTSGSRGLCSILAQGPKFTLNTKQKCILSDEARLVGDLAHLLSLQALSEAGMLDYSKAVEQMKEGTPMICVVPEPESCCISGMCAGPYNQEKTLAARKAGCSSSFHAWASLTWPPICTSEWENEPHCVQERNNNNYDWRETLRHEVFNIAVQRWTKVWDPSYRDKIYTEIEPVMRERFNSAMTKDNNN